MTESRKRRSMLCRDDSLMWILQGEGKEDGERDYDDGKHVNRINDEAKHNNLSIEL